MNLVDLVRRTPVPMPWAEGEKIPWNEPAFSARMLYEHLSQAHDAASRRASVIASHVEWIHRVVLDSRPSRILDLGCGPGLYTTLLANHGHECVGIDFAPAAVAYARETARAADLRCAYQLGDIRAVEYGDGYDLVMILYGEFNVFRPGEAHAILTKARQALVDGGQLLLEAHTAAAVQAMGETPGTWRTAEQGLFATRAHLRLQESFWNSDQQVATTRYFIVDAATASVAAHAESVQAYSADAYHSLLADCGFSLRRIHGSLDGTDASDEFIVLLGTAQ